MVLPNPIFQTVSLGTWVNKAVSVAAGARGGLLLGESFYEPKNLGRGKVGPGVIAACPCPVMTTIRESGNASSMASPALLRAAGLSPPLSTSVGTPRSPNRSRSY